MDQAQHPLSKMSQQSWRKISHRHRQNHEADQRKGIYQEVVTDRDQGQDPDRGSRAEVVAVHQVTTGEAVVEATSTVEAQEAEHLPGRSEIGNGVTG